MCSAYVSRHVCISMRTCMYVCIWMECILERLCLCSTVGHSPLVREIAFYSTKLSKNWGNLLKCFLVTKISNVRGTSIKNDLTNANNIIITYNFVPYRRKKLQNNAWGNSLTLNTVLNTYTISSRNALVIRQLLLKRTVRGTRYRCC